MRPLSTDSLPCQCTYFSSRFQPKSTFTLQRTVSPSGATGSQRTVHARQYLTVLNDIYVVNTTFTGNIQIDTAAVAANNITHESIVETEVYLNILSPVAAHTWRVRMASQMASRVSDGARTPIRPSP